MTPEPQSVALIRAALEAYNNDHAGELQAAPNATAQERIMFACARIALFNSICNPSAIAEVLQHVVALSAQVREMGASRSAMEILANFAHRTAIGAIDRADLENEGRLALAQANDCFPRPPPPDAALSAAARGK